MSKQSGWRIKQIVWPDAVAPVRKTGPDWLNPNLLTRREVVRIVCWLGGIWLGWQIAAGLPRELERDGGQWRAVATEVHTAEGVARQIGSSPFAMVSDARTSSRTFLSEAKTCKACC